MPSNPASRSPLPSPRDLLTSIFNSLTQTSPPPPPPQAAQQPNSSNPLKTLSATQRSLLVTLHVLFPSILLPALDLLDRGLVTQVVQAMPSGSSLSSSSPVLAAEEDAPFPSRVPAAAPTTARTQQQHQQQQPNPPTAAAPAENNIYIVRSAQQEHHSRGGQHANTNTNNSIQGSGNSYIVHLTAWNCTCPAFAFSAFPASSSSSFGSSFLPRLKEEAMTDEEEATGTRDATASTGTGTTASPRHPLRNLRTTSTTTVPTSSSSSSPPLRNPEWQFGGLSYDGTNPTEDAGDTTISMLSPPPPCCKHLLACVLAERLLRRGGGGGLGDDRDGGGPSEMGTRRGTGTTTGLKSYVKQVRVGREEMAGLGVG